MAQVRSQVAQEPRITPRTAASRSRSSRRGGGLAAMQEPSAPSLNKLRKVIKEAFGYFDKIGNNTVQQDEVGTIMRYLGQFPSESDLKDIIIPELLDDDP